MRVCGLRRRRGDARRIGCHDLHMADGTDRRAVAGAHARRAQHAHFCAQLFRQVGEEPFGPGKRARQRIAHPHGDGRRRRLAFLHDVEMGVKGRDFIDLGKREPHLLRQRDKMGGREMTVAVLDQMQMLDQEIAPAFALAKERAHLFERLRIDLAALRRARRPAPAGSPAVVRRQSRRRLGQAHFYWQPRPTRPFPSYVGTSR